MTPEDITTLFAEASELFAGILGQPTEANLHELREVIYPILLDIPFDSAKGKQNLVGIIDNPAEYAAEYGQVFERLERKGAYDPAIPADATNQVRAKGEAMWKAAGADEKAYSAAERCVRTFILSKVEDTWVRELRHARTFYSKVHAITILEHLERSCLGTHAIDALSLQVKIREYHHSAEGVPEYINMLEDAQRTAIRIDKNNPITDASVLAIATASMLSSQQFPRATEEWEHLQPAAKTWNKWKTIYKEAQGLERICVVAGGESDSFGGSNIGGANAAIPAALNSVQR